MGPEGNEVQVKVRIKFCSEDTKHEERNTIGGYYCCTDTLQVFHYVIVQVHTFG